MIKPLSLPQSNGAYVDPAPRMPEAVLIQVPEIIESLKTHEVKELSIDNSIDSYMTMVVVTSDKQAPWAGFLDKVISAIRYEKNALSSIDLLLKIELQADLDGDHEPFEEQFFSHTTLMARAKFRSELAHGLYAIIRGSGLYMNGYLFYNVTRIIPSAIVMEKINYASLNLV